MIVQLFDKDKNPMIASDGVLRVDGRKTNSGITEEVRKRNKSFQTHFPHKIAHFWAESTLGTPQRYQKDYTGNIHPVG